MSGLQHLLDEATAGVWALAPDGTVYGGRDGWTFSVATIPTSDEAAQADARLIALAPDMARLLIDMAAFMEGEGDFGEGAALLARFAELDRRAAQ